jgi:hypothetical protein
MAISNGQQTSVADAMTIGFPGLLADGTNLKNCDSKYNAEASAELPWGCGVVRHSSDEDNAVVKPHTSAAAAAPLFAGVLAHSHDYAPDIEVGTTGPKSKVTCSVLTHGRIYVLPEENVTPGDAVRMRVVTAGAEVAGKFRTTADGTDCINLSKIARWVTTGSSTVPAILEIDLTGAADVAADT